LDDKKTDKPSTPSKNPPSDSQQAPKPQTESPKINRPAPSDEGGTAYKSTGPESFEKRKK